MKTRLTILLSLAFLAAMAAPYSASDDAAKGKGHITNAGKKGAKDKTAPADQSQKGGKKGGEKAKTPAKGK